MSALHLPRHDAPRPDIPQTDMHRAALTTARAAAVTVSNTLRLLEGGTLGPVDAHMIRGWGAQLATYGRALEEAADRLAVEDRMREAGCGV